MKYTKHLIILSAMLIFLSSCGSLSITQKRYSRGLNIDWFSGKDDKKAVAKTTTKKKELKSTVAQSEASAITSESTESEALEMNSTADAIEPIITNEQVVAVSSELTKENKKEHRKLNRKLKAVQKLAAISHSKKAEIKASRKSLTQPNQTDEAGLITVILVIIALFIPPLAVLLKDMELNSAFWLNLLLYILAALLYGAGFGLLAGLVALIAVIHAILYVIEVI